MNQFVLCPEGQYIVTVTDMIPNSKEFGKIPTEHRCLKFRFATDAVDPTSERGYVITENLKYDGKIAGPLRQLLNVILPGGNTDTIENVERSLVMGKRLRIRVEHFSARDGQTWPRVAEFLPLPIGTDSADFEMLLPPTEEDLFPHLYTAIAA